MKTSSKLAAITIATLTACAPTKQLSTQHVALSPNLDQQARALASYDLFDPESTRLRSLRAYQLSNGDIAICGQQNARNRLGGYVVFQALHIRFTPGRPPIRKSLHREFLAQTACNALDSGKSLPVAEG